MFGGRYLPFQSVHSPVQAPAQLIARYQGRPRPDFMAMVKALDDAIGVILAALDTSGRADQTVHLITTDNGGCFWSFGNKCVNTAAPQSPPAETTGVKSTHASIVATQLAAARQQDLLVGRRHPWPRVRQQPAAVAARQLHDPDARRRLYARANAARLRSVQTLLAAEPSCCWCCRVRNGPADRRAPRLCAAAHQHRLRRHVGRHSVRRSGGPAHDPRPPCLRRRQRKDPTALGRAGLAALLDEYHSDGRAGGPLQSHSRRLARKPYRRSAL